MKGNLDALDEIITPDVVSHGLHEPDIVGLDAYKEFMKWIRSIFPECRIIFDEVMMSGDRGIFQYTFQGTLAAQRNEKWIFQNKETGKSETIGVSVPAGAKYTQKGCSIGRLVNGKTVEEWKYSSDIVPALTAAGIELKREPVE